MLLKERQKGNHHFGDCVSISDGCTAVRLVTYLQLLLYCVCGWVPSEENAKPCRSTLGPRRNPD